MWPQMATLSQSARGGSGWCRHNPPCTRREGGLVLSLLRHTAEQVGSVTNMPRVAEAKRQTSSAHPSTRKSDLNGTIPPKQLKELLRRVASVALTMLEPCLPSTVRCHTFTRDALKVLVRLTIDNLHPSIRNCKAVLIGVCVTVHNKGLLLKGYLFNAWKSPHRHIGS